MSFRSGRFMYREVINNKLSVGADLGFASYKDHLEPDLYTNGSTSIYAELFPYAKNYGLTFSAEYYLYGGNWATPFCGLGLGASYNQYTFYYNVYQDNDKVWGVLVRPNIGSLIKIGNKGRWAARVSLCYDYSTASSKDFDYKNFTNLGLDAGIALVIR